MVKNEGNPGVQTQDFVGRNSKGQTEWDKRDSADSAVSFFCDNLHLDKAKISKNCEKICEQLLKLAPFIPFRPSLFIPHESLT